MNSTAVGYLSFFNLQATKVYHAIDQNILVLEKKQKTKMRLFGTLVL